jgi:hypothetical protein
MVMLTKVAIVGGSPSWSEAPFSNEEWEIWVLGNQLDRYEGKRVSKIFEIHEDLSEHPPEYPQWLFDQSIPLVVSDKFPLKAEIFPKEEAHSLMPDMLSSSPAYMMAYAILKGATNIGIYGVDMAVDDHEYFKQRPAMYAWIAYARASGIEVTISENSSLFRDQYDEGRDWHKKIETPFSVEGFNEMISIHQNKIEELNAKIQGHHGALQAYQRLSKIARAIDSGQNVKNLTDSLIIKE